VSSDDGGRTLVLSFQRGETAVRRELVTDIVLDRGVWREGQFKKGDGVTWAGSFFIAQRDTDAKPEGPESGWRLAVKRGRDGKDGKAGEKGERGGEGRPGRDGRQV
jgi:collagen type III alpha